MSKLALPIAGAVVIGVVIALVIVFWDQPEESRPALPSQTLTPSTSPAGQTSSLPATPPASGSGPRSETGTKPGSTDSTAASAAASPASQSNQTTTSTKASSENADQAETAAAPQQPQTSLPAVKPVEVPSVSEARVPSNPLRPAKTGKHTNPRAGSLARTMIAEIRAGKSAYNPEALLDRSKALRTEGKLVDAHLLNFFSAREGYGPAAFSLAASYDPVGYEASKNIMDEPDAAQAYKWYVKARDAGIEAATKRLDALHQWVSEAAKAGDPELQVLLKQWK